MRARCRRRLKGHGEDFGFPTTLEPREAVNTEVTLFIIVLAGPPPLGFFMGPRPTSPLSLSL